MKFADGKQNIAYKWVTVNYLVVLRAFISLQNNDVLFPFLLPEISLVSISSKHYDGLTLPSSFPFFPPFLSLIPLLPFPADLWI